MSQEQQSYSSGRRFCPNCGVEQELEANFCSSCGESIDRTDSPPNLQVSNQRLTPSDLGQILGRTVTLVRRYPILFIGLGLVPEIATTIFWLSSPLPGNGGEFFNPFEFGAEPGTATLPSDLVLPLLVLGIAAVILSTFVEAATIYAVTSLELNIYPPVNVWARQALRKLVLIILAAICLGITIMVIMIPVVLLSLWLPFLLPLVAVPLILFVVINIWFFPQAIVVENRGPIAALLRSRELVRGDWWRVFGTGVVYVLVYMGVFGALLVISIPLGMISDVLRQIITLLANALSVPWFFIGSTLLYLDLRSRKENCTLEELAADLARPNSPQTPLSI